MSQFLIVQGRDPRAVREVFERGLAVFEAVHGTVPRAIAGDDTVGDDTGAEGTTRVAVFARRLVPDAGLVRNDATGEWALAAGTCVRSDGDGAGGRRFSDEDRALRSLGSALLDDGDSLAAAVRGLDGAFVVVAGSERTGDVALLTDRAGALHAYHASDDGCALVSSSALVLAAITEAAFDPVAVRELLAAHSVFESRSLWAGIEKLPAASVVRLRGGAIVSERRWWSLGDACWGRSQHAAKPAELADSVVASLDALLTAHPGAVLDLTGGFDSRILVAAALRTGLPFSTVVNGPESEANVVAASRIAAEFGLDHRNQVPGRDFPHPEFRHLEDACALGDGEANVFDYAPTMLAHTGTARSHGMAVNGSYGEVSRGYWWDVLGAHVWSRKRFDARRLALARFACDPWVDEVALGRFPGTVADHFTGVVERAVADLGGLPDVAKVDAVYLRLRMERWHGRIASLVAQLRPTAAPFAFRAPLEAALSMTPGARWGGRVARAVVERLEPALAALPMANGAPATPIRLTNVHRHGAHFAETAVRAGRVARRALHIPPTAAKPPAVWRAGDVWRLQELSDLLRPESMLTRDFFDEAALVRLVERTRADRAAPAATLGRVVTLELAARAVAAARAEVLSAPASR